jgi:hypothetical protein
VPLSNEASRGPIMMSLKQAFVNNNDKSFHSSDLNENVSLTLTIQSLSAYAISGDVIHLHTIDAIEIGINSVQDIIWSTLAILRTLEDLLIRPMMTISCNEHSYHMLMATPLICYLVVYQNTML